MEDLAAQLPTPSSELLNAFRTAYAIMENRTTQAVSNATDPIIFQRLIDDLNELWTAVIQSHLKNREVFSETESETVQTNILLLQGEAHVMHQRTLDESHHGRPSVISHVHNGGRGRPRIQIDPEFLRMTFEHRGVTGTARYLGCGVSVVRRALLEAGIVEPGANPFPSRSSQDSTAEALPSAAPQTPLVQPTTNYPQPSAFQHTSIWADSELDEAVRGFRIHYPRCGIAMLDGMLRHIGQRVPKERIRKSLHRVDPVKRVFQRIRIKRRRYRVPGPNSLWHHDGQHGLIRWMIVIHAFIDGYSRCITGIRASNNNLGQTVLALFLEAAGQFGRPSRLRGDHGVENIQVAAYMETMNGLWRGSYIWGRSVHNVRIERLWVDVTTQFGAKWADFFTSLELRYGLDVNNHHHLWLLHFLFLADINAEANFFQQSWNRHKMQMKGHATRSPADMFLLDMVTNGVRGEQLSAEELELYGVDWEALRQTNIMSSQLQNNAPSEGISSWVGSGPPLHMNEVPVMPPPVSLTEQDTQDLLQFLGPLLLNSDAQALAARWTHALAFVRTRSSIF